MSTFWKIALGVGCGILLAVVAVFVACGLFVGKVATNMQEQNQKKQEALSHVKFEDIEGRSEGDFMYLRGKVRNTGDVEVSYVKVGVDWLDAAGGVLDTDWTYAVSGEGLDPGAAKSFEIMTPKDERMERFRYYVKRD